MTWFLSGVETRAKDFGGLSGIAYLDNFHAIKYFEPLIEALLLLPGASKFEPPNTAAFGTVAKGWYLVREKHIKSEKPI